MFKYKWKIYIVLSERLWPSFFFLKYGLDNRICRGILLEIGHLNCRIKQMSHVTLQTNFRQAPTKRPATTAAGPKTKKAKVAKARVVSTWNTGGVKWLPMVESHSVWSCFFWFFPLFFCRVWFTKLWSSRRTGKFAMDISVLNHNKHVAMWKTTHEIWFMPKPHLLFLHNMFFNYKLVTCYNPKSWPSPFLCSFPQGPSVAKQCKDQLVGSTAGYPRKNGNNGSI